MDYELNVSAPNKRDYYICKDIFPCGDRIKYSLDKTFIVTNSKHLDLYIRFINKFKFNIELTRINKLSLNLVAKNENESVFIFRLFRYLRNDILLNVLKDANSYKCKPHTALCLAVFKNIDSLKNREVFNPSRDIFQISLSFDKIPELISKSEFSKRLRYDDYNNMFTGHKNMKILNDYTRKAYESAIITCQNDINKNTNVKYNEQFLKELKDVIRYSDHCLSIADEYKKNIVLIKELITSKQLKKAIVLMNKTNKLLCTKLNS